MEEKKKPERLEYTIEEYKTERKRGKRFLILGLVIIAVAVLGFAIGYETKIIPLKRLVYWDWFGFVMPGMIIAMNGFVMILAANIKLERSIGEDVNELGELVDAVKKEVEEGKNGKQ